ncbi:MAG TPA: CRTAC1 family protein [Gemmataceae bacterium]|nr:CRTAC1 family protein [Gemmataceae bacterium]
MLASSPRRAGWNKWWLLVVLLPAAGVGAWATLLPPASPAPKPHRASPALADTQPPDEDLPPYVLAPVIQEDSGMRTVFQHFVLPLRDPTSLEDIRDCFHDAGSRGIRRLEDDMARGVWPQEVYPHNLMRLAQLCLYQGQYTKAARVLKKLRDILEEDPVRRRAEIDMVITLQGITGLRRGETENCVECGVVSSCIFPIEPAAVHGKPQGSRQAIKYFTELLDRYPDDVGIQWLLNIAYMTLGEYPKAVPPRYLIPLDKFQSEFDIGRFADVAPKLGLNRLNLAGGAIMDDFDNDGLLDIVLTDWDTGGPMAFYRNRGDGTFEDRSKASGLDKQLGGLYCVQTDYNNDGWLDIYVARGAWSGVPQRHSLLRNNGDGTFTDVTKEAGLLTPVDGQVAVWADYDNDGYLDLFVGGEKTRSRLYHNRGDGTFEEVALEAGVANEGFMCKGANWGDFNGDRYPDLFVNNLNGPPRLFRNNRNGTFTDVAAEMGITQPTAGFPCWFFDYDNDGWPDIFAAAYERHLPHVINSHLGRPHKGQVCRLYRNLGGKGFEDVTAKVGLDQAMCPMGCNFADLDNDGYLDIYLGTGTPDYQMLVPNRMFKNVDGKRFADITVSSRTGHLQKGHAVACGDWDRDGNVDMFQEIGGAVPGDRFRSVLWQNPGHANHWITVKLVGKKTNRPAIGARIKVTVPGGPARSIYRHVTSGSSFGANALEQTIGIGKAQKIQELEVYWPTTDSRQVFRDVPIDQAIEITEFARDYRRLNWKRIPLPK